MNQKKKFTFTCGTIEIEVMPGVNLNAWSDIVSEIYVPFPFM